MIDINVGATGPQKRPAHIISDAREENSDVYSSVFTLKRLLQGVPAITRIIPTVIILLAVYVSSASVVHADDTNVNIWWPTANAQITGMQPFKGMYSNLSASEYQMYWQVDGGQLNPMSDNATDYPHKESQVDLTSWRWNANGAYTLTFVAMDKNGSIIGKKSVPIIVPNSVGQVQTALTKVTASSVATASTPTVPAWQSTGIKLYVNPDSRAAIQANEWRYSRPGDAAKMDVLAGQPTAMWLGNWNANVQSDVQSLVTKAQQNGAIPVMVAYNIPGRDCGGYSAGGAAPDQYLSWIQSVASGIGSRDAIVVLEPDALAGISCLSSQAANERVTLMSKAITLLKNNPRTRVYVDAGHAGWIDPNTMANRLKQVNVERADGFALNVSNFGLSQDQVSYGTQISQTLGGTTHFVIDTSRNGRGPDGANWCNPSGRAIGTFPTYTRGTALLDGNLWLKTPGESDGSCNGGPGAGVWWPEYALDLVRNAGL